MLQLLSNYLKCFYASAQKISGSHYNFKNTEACQALKMGRLSESKIYQMLSQSRHIGSQLVVFSYCVHWNTRLKKLILKLMQNFQLAAPGDWRKWDPLAKFNTPSHSTGTMLLLKHVGRKSRNKDVWNWSCDLAAVACPYQKYWLPFLLPSFQVTAPYILTDGCYHIMSEQRGSRRRTLCGAIYLT